MRPIYLYVHIPRTGGQSVISYLSEHIGTTRLCMVNRRNADEMVSRLSQPEFSEQIDVVIGHKVTLSMRRFFPDRQVRFVTALRDPVDHMVSIYNQIAHPIRGTRTPPPEFDKWLVQHRNYQARWLIRKFAARNVSKAEADLEVRDQAKDLIRNFWLVGTLDNIKRSLAPLRRSLGIAQPLKAWKNIGGHDYERAVSRTPAVEQKIREACPVDFALMASLGNPDSCSANSPEACHPMPASRSTSICGLRRAYSYSASTS